MAPGAASERRTAELEKLAARARAIPFVTLVEHLERWLGTQPVGATGLLRDELVRFRHDPELVFHSSDVASMRLGPGGRVELTSTFLGATGSVSPLATFFTEDILRERTQDANTLGAFYDLFHHRLIALCYRALRRSALPWSIRTSGDDVFTGRALAITGLPPHRHEEALSPVARLGHSRVLARRPRGRAALEAALALAFPGLPVNVVDIFPRSVRLSTDQHLRLGRRNNRLGHETRIGRHMHGQGGLVRLVVGPVDRPTFDSLLPGAKQHTRLREVVDEVTGGLLEVEPEIELHFGEEPRTVLGGRGKRPPRLGHGSLVRGSKPNRPLRVRIALSESEEPSRPTYLEGGAHRPERHPT